MQLSNAHVTESSQMRSTDVSENVWIRLLNDTAPLLNLLGSALRTLTQALTKLVGAGVGSGGRVSAPYSRCETIRLTTIVALNIDDTLHF